MNPPTPMAKSSNFPTCYVQVSLLLHKHITWCAVSHLLVKKDAMPWRNIYLLQSKGNIFPLVGTTQKSLAWQQSCIEQDGGCHCFTAILCLLLARHANNSLQRDFINSNMTNDRKIRRFIHLCGCFIVLSCALLFHLICTLTSFF